ncbi:MAG TPA: hypothetical protein VGB92_00950 [Longimicrobium sp.]|jgi:hypothetical protein
MRTVCAIFSVLLLGACATLRGGTPDDGRRTRLWEQAHAAYAQDSFRVAAAAFQRLANEHPRTTEGHESRFYLGVLSLEPRSSVDLALARQQLQMYLADDSVQALRGYHLREAGSLLRLVTELQRPCDARAGAVACDPRVVTRVVTEPGSGNGDSSAATAEASRLRREVAERDQTIRDLREELQRIRNTLAPRRQPRE